jgi:alpha-L-arabinofuranosidase
MSHKENVPMDQLGPWVQDALDAIEYANGPATSQWGAVRAKNGHPAPFYLQHMEIGNENGGQAYHERYAVFYKAIKDKYPYMRLVADVWQGVPKDLPLEILDEHYYNDAGFFFQNANRYDSYDRKGPKIYVGEYAVTRGCGQGNLRAALGEAAFMTGMERNSDVVVLSSYAPLFANVNYKKWNPDLINFNNARAYGTPSYYVQKMFSENRGDVVLPVQLQADAPVNDPPHGAFGLGTWETQSEYKDIKVTHGEQVLFDLSQSLSNTLSNTLSPGDTTGLPSKALLAKEGWRIFGGDWQAKDGAIQQTATGPDRRALAGDPAWRDCTITLKARKLGGREGFLVLFHVQDDNNFLWWNVGGWANSKHSIEKCLDGAKSYLGRDKTGKIETGRWYDLRIELKGPNIQCFLDGQKVNEAVDAPHSQPLHTVASRVEATGDIILKTVNPGKTDCETEIQIGGVKKVGSTFTVSTLTSPDPADENSLDHPLKVFPKQQTLKAPHSALRTPHFHYTFPANSVTVLRLKTEALK